MTQPELRNFWLRFIRTASVWCFLFVTLFNLQGTRRSRRNIAILANFISFVKNFFQKFSTRDPFCPAATRLSYHTLLSLSSPFFGIFQPRFQGPAEVITSATALLEYQMLRHLSTPFPRFFLFFEYRLSVSLISVLPMCKTENNLCKPVLTCYNVSQVIEICI